MHGARSDRSQRTGKGRCAHVGRTWLMLCSATPLRLRGSIVTRTRGSFRNTPTRLPPRVTSPQCPTRFPRLFLRFAMAEFNYGQSQIDKLGIDDDWKIKIISSNYEDAEITGETHWMDLTPRQKNIIAALIVEFKKE